MAPPISPRFLSFQTTLKARPSKPACHWDDVYVIVCVLQRRKDPEIWRRKHNTDKKVTSKRENSNLSFSLNYYFKPITFKWPNDHQKRPKDASLPYKKPRIHIHVPRRNATGRIGRGKNLNGKRLFPRSYGNYTLKGLYNWSKRPLRWLC